MQTIINGRTYGMEEFTMQFEKIGVCGIEITLASVAKAKIVNLLVDELKFQLLHAFETLPDGDTYLRAFDLLDLALTRLAEKYERHEMSFARRVILDTQQLPLFKRLTQSWVHGIELKVATA